MPVTVTPVQELIIDLAVRYGFQVLGAMAILTVGALLARWVGRLTDARLTRATIWSRRCACSSCAPCAWW